MAMSRQYLTITKVCLFLLNLLPHYGSFHSFEYWFCHNMLQNDEI